ncbi:MAG: anthranilate phosphoribosyltransferase [Planctomycetota bacterium]|nr:anthranilate phosphoribosyltransferase [Planctomycetota bacterium]
MNDTNPISVGPSEFVRSEAQGELAPYLVKLVGGETLSFDESVAAFTCIMRGRAHHGEMGALLAFLASRVPTEDELAGAAVVMRLSVDRVPTSLPPVAILDTAGTGGAPKTFNVGTAAAIVAAACGARVAKHGNRSRTGRGSAEVLEALGVQINASREVQRQCLDTVGVCFCYAVQHHPAARHAMPVRRVLGFPTIFNLLGPLTNPAGARRQLMGVYAQRFVDPVAGALRKLDTARAIVVHSLDGLDEISTGADTIMVHVRGDEIERELFHPESVGIAKSDPLAVVPSNATEAAVWVRELLDGSMKGTPRDMLLLNSAAALLAAGVAFDMPHAMDQVREALATGAASSTLDRLIAVSSGMPDPGEE